NDESSIIAGNLSSQINARTVVLGATGSVGAVTYQGLPSAPEDAPIAVRLTGGGFLSASAGSGNVYVTTRSDMAVDQISAAGDVVDGKGNVTLVALGSISAWDDDALI